MHIALVTDYYAPTLGGVQTAVRALAESLRAAGHEATVFCPLAGPSPEEGVVALPVAGAFRPDGYPFAWPPRRVAAALADEFARRGVDVVHTHSEMFAALGGVRAAHERGLPVVHTMHGRVDVYTASVLPLPAVTTLLLAGLHARQVSHAGLRVAGGTRYTATATARRMWRLMLAQSRASDHVVVPSAHFARKLADQGVVTPMTVLTNGLEESVAAAAGTATPRVLGADEPLRLVWAGRLSPEKRPGVLVEAARSFGDRVSVDVYGDGGARRSLERRAGRVTFHGAVPHGEVLTAMRSAHALVSSSWDFDNQPMVVLEAAATGLPVVHCDPDLAEVVPDGGGFLTPTPDAAGLVATVERLRREPALLTTASEALLRSGSVVGLSAEPLLEVYRSVTHGR